MYKDNDKEDSNKLSNKEIINKSVNIGLDFLQERTTGEAGLICICKNGEFTCQFNTKTMAWAAIDGNKLYYGIESGQIVEQELIDLDLII